MLPTRSTRTPLPGLITGALLLASALLTPAAADTAPAQAPAWSGQAPAIALWYGSHQRFGRLGTPQRWLNVLGNISPAEDVARAAYRLDGGPEQSLAIGPDTRRLAQAGDFNIEIPVQALIAADTDPATAHSIEIRAFNDRGAAHATSMSFEYDARTAWPLPYRIRWQDVARIDDAVQVVDGRWRIGEKGLRPAVPGYDRTVAVGDARWGDVEMLAEVTLHGIDAAGYEPPSNGPGFGFLTRWQGHNPAGGRRPAASPWPSGTLLMYRWRRAWPAPRLGMFGNGGSVLAMDERGFEFEIDKTYLIALRLVTPANGRSACGVKVWQVGTKEPEFWHLTANLEPSAPKTGSILFVAHHADVSIGQWALRATVDNP